MIAFPNCKINLGLHIVGKRKDGYHDLETIFFPLPLYDVLEIIQSTTGEQNEKLFLSGVQLDAGADTNLCVKAYDLLKKDFPDIPPIDIFLHKTIPVSAGLGGGSANAAFTLLLLNKKFNLGLSGEQLSRYAFALGSDCPFFLVNKPCCATGRGENMELVSLDLSAYKLVLVNPRIQINTKWAFSRIKTASGEVHLKDIISQPVRLWKDLLKNDFEEPVFSAYAQIGEIKKTLYESGALYAAMSGSGSSVFAIFKEPVVKVNSSVFPDSYFVKELSLLKFSNVI